MKKKMMGTLGVMTAVLVSSVMAVMPVFADVETNILPGNLDIDGLLQIILTVLVYGIGAAAILGMIIVGIQYMTARDNEQQMAKAKTRLIEIVIGLVAWAVMVVVLNWLIPGAVAIPGLT